MPLPPHALRSGPRKTIYFGGCAQLPPVWHNAASSIFSKYCNHFVQQMLRLVRACIGLHYGVFLEVTSSRPSTMADSLIELRVHPGMLQNPSR